MKPVLVAALLLAAGPCSTAPALTATVSAEASSTANVGDAVQLVVKVTNTGPWSPHLGCLIDRRRGRD